MGLPPGFHLPTPRGNGEILRLRATKEPETKHNHTIKLKGIILMRNFIEISVIDNSNEPVSVTIRTAAINLVMDNEEQSQTHIHVGEDIYHTKISYMEVQRLMTESEL